jgi:hypothetical protein
MSWVQKLFNKNFVNCCETEGIIIYSLENSLILPTVTETPGYQEVKWSEVK